MLDTILYPGGMEQDDQRFWVISRSDESWCMLMNRSIVRLALVDVQCRNEECGAQRRERLGRNVTVRAHRRLKRVPLRDAPKVMLPKSHFKAGLEPVTYCIQSCTIETEKMLFISTRRRGANFPLKVEILENHSISTNTTFVCKVTCKLRIRYDTDEYH